MRVRVPASRSVAQDELLLSALADGRSHLDLGGLDPGDDVRAMREAVAALGCEVEGGPAGVVRVSGGAPSSRERAIDVGDARTVAVPMAALAATRSGRTRIDGSERLRWLPIGPLVHALRKLGAEVEGDSLPLTVSGPLRGGHVEVTGPGAQGAAIALLLIAPATERGIELRIAGSAVSDRLLERVVRSLEDRAVKVERGEMPTTFWIAPQRVKARDVAVPGDVAAASYPAAAAAILGGRATIENLDTHARSDAQDDERVFRVLEAMGCRVSRYSGGITVRRAGTLYGIRDNVRDLTDAFPLLAVVAACAQGRSEVLGARRTDGEGVAAVVAGLQALGADVTEYADGIAIDPAPLHGGVVDAAGDARVAMAFAILGLQVQDVAIEGSEAVSKAYPDFWTMVRALAG